MCEGGYRWREERLGGVEGGLGRGGGCWTLIDEVMAVVAWRGWGGVGGRWEVLGADGRSGGGGGGRWVGRRDAYNTALLSTSQLSN